MSVNRIRRLDVEDSSKLCINLGVLSLSWGQSLDVCLLDGIQIKKPKVHCVAICKNASGGKNNPLDQDPKNTTPNTPLGDMEAAPGFGCIWKTLLNVHIM